jgi:hypothetical protein
MPPRTFPLESVPKYRRISDVDVLRAIRPHGEQKDGTLRLSCSQKTHKNNNDTVRLRYVSLSNTGSIASITLHYTTLHYTTLHYITLHYTTNPYFNPKAIMPPRCCIVCTAEASPDLVLQYCAACQSALYCSETCQKTDWNEQHKKICKLLNVGHGDMQLRNDEHMSRSIELMEQFESEERSLTEDMKRFFKLFEESTFEGRWAAARKMREIIERQTNHNRKFLLFHSLHFLIRTSNSKMLSWPNSPLLVLLEFVDPSVLSGDDDAPLREGEERVTALHYLAYLADPSHYSTHVNQLILAKQLIEHGANVNAVSIPDGRTPLHSACSGVNVTNLDFVELLLKEGADPNAQISMGVTPLMITIPHAPGAAKFLLNWPTTDVNITTGGVSFMLWVRSEIANFSTRVALPGNPEKVQHQFLLQQWRGIEVMVVERGAHT